MKVGDKVAVLDEDLKGIITEISGDSITIETNDGFPFKYNRNELVLVGENQSELSRYSDIENAYMIEKPTEKSTSSNSLFKSDKKNIPPMEVDLHINQLTESTRGLDNYDILTIQMETAKHKLEFAIRNRIQRIIFIHGVGAGVLKTELDYLFKNYPVKWYAASFKKYGLGATEVYVLQNPKTKH